MPKNTARRFRPGSSRNVAVARSTAPFCRVLRRTPEAEGASANGEELGLRRHSEWTAAGGRTHPSDAQPRDLRRAGAVVLEPWTNDGGAFSAVGPGTRTNSIGLTHASAVVPQCPKTRMHLT